MRCERALDALLEADGQTLRGRGSDPLAEHVSSCPRCGRVAELFLEAQEDLARQLEREAGGASSQLLEAVLRGAAEPRRTPSRHALARHVGSLSRPYWWVPALAAAWLALALWPEEPAPPVGATLPARAALEQPPLIEPPAGRDFAVLGTDDPAITVVWFF